MTPSSLYNTPFDSPAAHRLRSFSRTGIIRSLLQDRLTPKELQAARLVELNRPLALRAYDQIPMQATDLMLQVKMMLPILSGKTVAFVGDYDSTSLLIGLLTQQKGYPAPAYMLILDFDARVLASALRLAQSYGFEDKLGVQLYNAFDPLPERLIGKFDWFYTNPPYGSRNVGSSARLFITRGCELVRQQRNASGCIILPDDESRPWTGTAMLATQQYLCSHGWCISQKIDHLHRYHLDDDRGLTSSMVLVKHLSIAPHSMPFAGRRVDVEEIPYFYGRSVRHPYPRYIDGSGNYDYSWDVAVETKRVIRDE